VPATSQTAVHRCSTKEEAYELFSHLNRGDVVLCKGSRSEKLEEVAQEVEKFWSKKIAVEEEGL
jgi:UDP-N-acetylmuramyl pentapeptide synthase